jgi:DNA polymerase-3 subunit epsilon
MLELTKPLAFLDLETTGLNIMEDRIVEFAIMKVNIDGSKEYLSGRVNPGIPITPGATAVHHITNKDVSNSPNFAEYAVKIAGILNDCDIAGFNNIRFDLPLLCEEFKRAKVVFTLEGRNIIDCLSIYYLKERRNLEAAYLFYCNSQLPVAHTAEGDTSILVDILEAQLNKYPDLPKDMKLLAAYCHQIPDNFIDKEGKFISLNGKVICNFSDKHRGHDIEYIQKNDPNFLHWIMREGFSQEVKALVKEYLPVTIKQLPLEKK